jgi:hypothetical protein
MTAILEDAVLPHTDPALGDLIMINSFNEWHEDTQIEASTISPLTNTDDSSTGMALTGGRYYEGYGGLYLDLLRDATLVAGDYNRDNVVDSLDYLAWRSNFGATGPNLWSDGNRNGTVDAADYVIWQRAAQSVGDAASRLNVVPEPSTVACLLFSLPILCRRPSRGLGRAAISSAQGAERVRGRVHWADSQGPPFAVRSPQTMS